MKKWIMLVLLFSAWNGFSQIPKSSQNFVRTDGKPQVKYAGEYFDVDTTVITIKVKDIQNIKNEYAVIRKNKLGFVDIQVPDKYSIEEFAAILSRDNSVEEIIIGTFGKLQFIPNDTYRTSQWYLAGTGAYSAWDITMGSSDVIVAIIDSGTEWTHSDLGLGTDSYQNIYLNPGEDVWTNPNNPTTGNGIDDDNNGLIDDWKGWDFVTNTNDSRGTYYHGTFVAGIVSAKTNNGRGIAGIAGGKHNKGVQMQIYCVTIGDIVISYVIDDAIIHAVDMGCRIIQLSLRTPYDPAIDAAIQYAVDSNVIIVCSSGNNYSSTVAYPASNPNVIAVGAMDQDYLRADYSNYGSQLNLVAPGEHIYSTTTNNSYAYDGGTSFAAPQVSATAALILSVNPNLTGQEVRNFIESTAQKASYTVYTYSADPDHPNGTWNNEMGYGLLNAAAAVNAASCTVPVIYAAHTVSTDTTVTSCGDIHVWNVNVINGAKLTLDAAGTVRILQNVEIELGSKLNIKGAVSYGPSPTGN
jgi:subtilisin family serine protease